MIGDDGHFSEGLEAVVVETGLGDGCIFDFFAPVEPGTFVAEFVSVE